MQRVRELFVQSFLLLSLGLTCRLASAQSSSCPLITIDDLGSDTQFSTQGLISEAIVPGSEAVGTRVPVRIRNFTVVCDASGDRRNTSSYVSVVVELQCNFSSSDASLSDCDGSTIVIRQYQFQCVEQNGQVDWDAIVSGSTSNVQTMTPTATLSTPLANQCRRCIDDMQSSRADTINHCDPCPSQCNLGQRRCYLGQTADECCNFYLQGNCMVDGCPSALEADSNFDCVCPTLTLANGAVSYSMEMGVERNIGSVATHTCNPGYRLSPPLQAGAMPTCRMDGWSDQNFTCERVPTLIQCPELSIESGKVIVTPVVRTVNSTAEYTCDSGYKLDKGDAKRRCQLDGTWSGEAPECSKTGLGTGEIVGIAVGAAVGVIIIALVITVVIVIVVKLSKKKTLPADSVAMTQLDEKNGKTV